MSSRPSDRARIVTWNVNSVRARLDLVDRFLLEHRPDVLCLQEIKVQTDLFPRSWFEERGYRHQAVHGQRNHHGVATVSRLPLTEVTSRDWCEKGDARHVAARLPGGVMVHNFYVPAGGDEPDRDSNPRFAHKLDFLDEMIAWSRELSEPSIMVGDLNVAPLERDVWSHRQLLKVVSHTPPETERMEAMRAAHDWVDVMRHFVSADEPLYSWWSYRSKDWRKSNRGRRLDHVWVSPVLQGGLKAMQVFDDARSWERPSDHAPVIVDLDLPVG
ncbi:exodeoxyribonuclease III [Iodidimonas muriae]|uniref:Exodeoxyribonuclease III n=1 Tax=Iodidimonas muriae TaxID=261467 RepID=A0ABQ2L9L4_9PROT|nr:exodeoxyribonuclease III [Iodidimonas muriae]GER05990.1 exodeoxyribonuclease III [Kordiimonadales bacterium JCM 17843]GGO07736.1 exodeoxyribonuclease III [Iodidimonas muriae]